MNTYSLTLLIDPKVLSNLSNDGYNLCMETYVTQNQGNIANLVVSCMSAGGYSGKNKISWTGEYQFSATQQSFKEGGVIDHTQATTWPAENITMKDLFVLTSWSEWDVQHNSPSAPSNGFTFEVGKGIQGGASGIVYINMAAGGESPSYVPSFISAAQDISGSTTSYIPLDQVVVFFNQGAQTGSMVTNSSSMTYSQVISMRQASTQTWELSDDGTWAQVVSS